MTTGLENPLSPLISTELVIAQTALVQRGLQLADLVLSHHSSPIWQQIGIQMIHIPAGPFFMGSDRDQDVDAEDCELPQHVVNLPDFYIARLPVTNEQYKQFVDTTGHATPMPWKGGCYPADWERHPITHVNWYEAQAFCAWAGVRLPTEAEWEKVARCTDGRIYPWGNELPTADLCNFAWNVDSTMPVGSYPKGASLYGVLDMAGNVWEWTSSLYKSYPYQAGDELEAPDERAWRTVRGGAFHNNYQRVCCATRYGNVPLDDFRDLGFRVALSSLALE